MAEPSGNTEYVVDHFEECERNLNKLAQDLDDRNIREVFTAIVWADEESCCVQSVLSGPSEVESLSYEIGCNKDQTKSFLICECNCDIDESDNSLTSEIDDDDDLSIDEGNVIKKSKSISAKLSCFSICIGLLMGCFIQMSSLGVTFLIKEQMSNLRVKGEYDQSSSSQVYSNDDQISFLTLFWSVLTSFFGVLLLYILGSVILMGARISPHSGALRILENYSRQMEKCFAIGSLTGVCTSWMLTDILLGFTAHSFQSALTLIAALIWVKVVSACTNRCEKKVDEKPPTSIEIKHKVDSCDDSDDQLKRPLLTTLASSSLSTFSKKHASNSYSSLDFNIRTCSFLQGLFIGIFVQRASLGANFLLSAIYGDGVNNHILYTSWDTIISFSVLWSFMASLMAGLAFFYMRSLTVMAWWVVDIPVVTIRHLTRNIECYFAAGAMIGVNLAWLYSDWLLGINLHSRCSVMIIVAALVWCKLVSYWYRLDRSYTVTLSPLSSTKVVEFEAYAPPRSDKKVEPIIYDV